MSISTSGTVLQQTECSVHLRISCIAIAVVMEALLVACTRGSEQEGGPVSESTTTSGDAGGSRSDGAGGDSESMHDATVRDVGPLYDGSAVDDGGARDAADCPDGIACNCTCPIGDDASGVCICEHFTFPVCNPVFPYGPCAHGDVCMECQGGAGNICGCVDGGFPMEDASGSNWLCIGTGYACTGGVAW